MARKCVIGQTCSQATSIVFPSRGEVTTRSLRLGIGTRRRALSYRDLIWQVCRMTNKTQQETLWLVSRNPFCPEIETLLSSLPTLAANPFLLSKRYFLRI